MIKKFPVCHSSGNRRDRENRKLVQRSRWCLEQSKGFVNDIGYSFASIVSSASTSSSSSSGDSSGGVSSDGRGGEGGGGSGWKRRPPDDGA
ncbi:hypothetical protein AB1K62_08365 [Parasphingorhabdus sp. JC815]|uniref:hypothetical protein n=1 Tax=Parasphingorhabdus sp. JC815 TaxID=3232140 RepID=UPI00345A9640